MNINKIVKSSAFRWAFISSLILLHLLYFLDISRSEVGPQSKSDAIPTEIYEFINNLHDNTKAVLDNDNLSYQQKRQESQRLIREVTNLDSMAKFTLGRYRNKLSAQQLDKFTNVYRNYLINVYSDSIKNYQGQKIHITKVIPRSKEKFLVKTKVNAKGRDYNIDYLLKRQQGYPKGFAVTDLIIENISIVNTHRDEFTSFLSSNSIEELIENLKTKY